MPNTATINIDMKSVIDTLRRIKKIGKYTNLSRHAQLKYSTLMTNKKRKKISPSALENFFSHMLSVRIQPLVENHKIILVKSRRANNGGRRTWTIKNDDVRKKLRGKRGVYIYHGSLGELIYVGKTVEQDFLTRIGQSLDKSTGYDFYGKDLKPERRKYGYVTKRLSAYEILPIYAISNIEALLTKVLCNILYNVRLEKFK
ncbi:MAG: hypothetical protein FJX47_14915 [Alphaproteobacteria bacterium]|nr:hypothetical protein [Alphaproteobacteria bacterium]